MRGQKGPGRMPLAADLVVECRRLLARGLSQRDVVEQLGISKGSVWSIANGHYGKRLVAPKGKREQRLKTPVRCPEGHLVNVLPCRTCTVRKFTQSAARRADSPFYGPHAH